METSRSTYKELVIIFCSVNLYNTIFSLRKKKTTKQICPTNDPETVVLHCEDRLLIALATKITSEHFVGHNNPTSYCKSFIASSNILGEILWDIYCLDPHLSNSTLFNWDDDYSNASIKHFKRYTIRHEDMGQLSQVRLHGNELILTLCC